MSMLRPLALSIAVLVLAACNPPDRVETKGEKTASIESSDAPDLSRAQELVSGASDGNMRATSVFDGPGSLVGIMTEPTAGGAKQLVWSSDGFEVLLPSEAIDKNGEPQNAKYMNEESGHISASDLASKVKDRGFIVGKSGPLLSVFMDPNCIHCHSFYEAAAPMIKKGDLRVRYLMVGFLREDSVDRSATIISAADPAKALDKDEKAFDKGGAPVSKSLTDEDRQKVLDLNELMNSAGSGGTPAIVACQKGAEEPTLLSGMPQDFTGFVANLDEENEACQ